MLASKEPRDSNLGAKYHVISHMSNSKLHGPVDALKSNDNLGLKMNNGTSLCDVNKELCVKGLLLSSGSSDKRTAGLGFGFEAGYVKAEDAPPMRKWKGREKKGVSIGLSEAKKENSVAEKKGSRGNDDGELDRKKRVVLGDCTNFEKNELHLLERTGFGECPFCG